MTDIIYKPTSQFWQELFPEGMTAEDITKELSDLEFVSENLSKVYMHITGDRASKPMIYAEVINSLHDDYVTETYKMAAEEIIDIIENKTAFYCVRTTWDNSQMESIKRDLIDEIKLQLGVGK
jgi:hypothetical protein